MLPCPASQWQLYLYQLRLGTKINSFGTMGWEVGWIVWLCQLNIVDPVGSWWRNLIAVQGPLPFWLGSPSRRLTGRSRNKGTRRRREREMLSLFSVSLWKIITGEAGRDAKKPWETSCSYEFVSSPIYHWDSGEGTQSGCFEKLNNRKDISRI